jgi:hypothetical protein
VETINNGIEWIKKHPGYAIGIGAGIILLLYLSGGSSSSTNSGAALAADQLAANTQLSEAQLAAQAQEAQTQGAVTATGEEYGSAQNITQINASYGLAGTENTNETNLAAANLGAQVQEYGISAQTALAQDTLQEQAIQNEYNYNLNAGLEEIISAQALPGSGFPDIVAAQLGVGGLNPEKGGTQFITPVTVPEPKLNT